MSDLNRKGDLPVVVYGPASQVGLKVNATNGSANTQVMDDSTGYYLKPRSDGSLNVNANVGGLPEIPEGSSRVTVTATPTDVATTAGVDTYYTVTNGKTLTLQSFSGGSEYDSSGSVIDLYYDPNGNLSVLTWIDTIYVNGSDSQHGIGLEYVGNGTRRIVMRRRGFSANAREMAARWYGYEETT